MSTRSRMIPSHILALALALAPLALAGTEPAGEHNLSQVQPAPARESGETADDALITARVKSMLFYDREVDGTALDVDTRDGKVVITGIAASATERSKAAALARGVRGVQAVDVSGIAVAGLATAAESDFE